MGYLILISLLVTSPLYAKSFGNDQNQKCPSLSAEDENVGSHHYSMTPSRKYGIYPQRIVTKDDRGIVGSLSESFGGTYTLKGQNDAIIASATVKRKYRDLSESRMGYHTEHDEITVKDCHGTVIGKILETAGKGRFGNETNISIETIDSRVLGSADRVMVGRKPFAISHGPWPSYIANIWVEHIKGEREVIWSMSTTDENSIDERLLLFVLFHRAQCPRSVFYASDCHDVGG